MDFCTVFFCFSTFYNIIHSVSFRFGAITMTSGIIGVPLGTYIAQRLKKNSPRADPIICACGLIISAPMLAGSMLVVSVNESLAYLLVFLGSVALNLNWAIVADILLVRIFETKWMRVGLTFFVDTQCQHDHWTCTLTLHYFWYNNADLTEWAKEVRRRHLDQNCNLLKE